MQSDIIKSRIFPLIIWSLCVTYESCKTDNTSWFPYALCGLSCPLSDCNENNSEARWYVAHTYSGYENKVKADIEKTIENRKLQDQIQSIAAIIQPITIAAMITATDCLPKSFLPGSKPVPLTESEMKNLGIRVPEMEIDVELGDSVKVVAGAWEGTVGIITDINTGKQSTFNFLSHNRFSSYFMWSTGPALPLFVTNLLYKLITYLRAITK